MKRRDFLKATGIAALAPSLALPPSSASASTVFRLEAGVIERALTPFRI